MPTTLHKIELPSLVNSNFGVNLKNVFENIDSNFQKLSSLGLTTGAAGKPSVWIPYNLNSVFCTELSPSTLSSSYLPAEVIKKIQDDYDKYKAITNRSAYMYVLECILMYNDMLEAIWTDPVDIQYNLTEDDIDTLPEGTEVGEHYWKQKWEKDIELNIDDLRHNEDSDSYTKLYNKIIEVCNVNRAARGLTCCGRTTDSTSENPPITNGNAKMQEYLYDGSHEGPYLPFLPGAIMVAGNMDDAIGGYTKIGTLSHIYIDPRFRSPYVIMGKLTDEELISLEAATDQSCVVYGTGTYDTDIDNYRLKFDYSYSFPRIHCQDGEFYLKVNDIATNIPLTGRTGKAGKDSQFAIVKLADDCGLNMTTYRSISFNNPEEDSTRTNTFEVGNTIPESQNWAEKKSTLDGCPAIVFPPDNFTPSSYTSVYWMTHLEWDANNNKLTAYCGRENLVEVSLYDHSFAGMMMGLDVNEPSISYPSGNQPWYRPRGLMLPIGSRYIDANGQWRPWYPNNWQPSNSADATHFSAHLIYSTGDNSGKKNLHISSVNDYRKIGYTQDPNNPDTNPHIPGNYGSSVVSGTKLFIDEPVEITNYQTTNYKTGSPLLNIPFGYERVSGYNDSGYHTPNVELSANELYNRFHNSTVVPTFSGVMSIYKREPWEGTANQVILANSNDLSQYTNKFPASEYVYVIGSNNYQNNSLPSDFDANTGVRYGDATVTLTYKPEGGSTQYINKSWGYGMGTDDLDKMASSSENKETNIKDKGLSSWVIDDIFDNCGFSFVADKSIKTSRGLISSYIGSSYIFASEAIHTRNILVANSPWDPNGQHSGNVLASHFVKKDSESGQILLANGYATAPTNPIRLKVQYGDGKKVTVNLNYHINGGDGRPTFENEDRLVCGEQMTTKNDWFGTFNVSGTSNSYKIYWGTNAAGGDGGGINRQWNPGGKLDYGGGIEQLVGLKGAIPDKFRGSFTYAAYNGSNGSTASGLTGAWFSYKSGSIVYTKILIAANGSIVHDWDKNGTDDHIYTYGLPIKAFSGYEGKDNLGVPRFNICLVPANGDLSLGQFLSPEVSPLNSISQTAHCISSYVTYGEGHWYDDRQFDRGDAGVKCTISPVYYDGVLQGSTILLEGADTNYLFSCNEWNGTMTKNNGKAHNMSATAYDYLEFNFVYPIALVSSSGGETNLNAPSHYVYTGELNVETGEPVNTDMTDTSVWHLADEFEGSTEDITYEIVAKQNPEADLDTDAKPTELNTESEEWTFEPYVEPEEPFQTEYNYIYTGTLTGGEPDVTDLTDDTVWFAASEYEGTHGDITARVKATYEGSNRIQHGPGTYNEREWDFDLVLEPHTHYWKCEGTSLPSEGMEMVVGNQVQAVNSVNVSVADYSYEEPDPEWFEDTEVWGLISVTATAKDLSDYTIKYKKANTGAGIEADSWSAKTNASEVTTYQWLGGDNYNIYRYLEQTRMAYYYEGWHGALFDLANDYKKNQNLSYGGFRGKIEISTGDPSMLSTTLPADMTIDCWNDDLTDHILDHYTISISNVQATMQGSLSISDHTITIVKSLSPLEWNSGTGFGPGEQYTPGGSISGDNGNSGSGTSSGSHTPTEITPNIDNPTTPGDTRP